MSRRSMAAAAANGRLVLFGGVGATGQDSILDVADDCWIFEPVPGQWSRVPERGPWPSPRRCAGFTNAGGLLHLWGGSSVDPMRSPQHTFLNDWWSLDPLTNHWTRVENSDDHRVAPIDNARPEPRYTPVFQTAGKALFLFGGYTEDRFGKRKMNDTWLFEQGTWSSVAVSGREGYAAPAEWPGLRYGCMSAATETAVFICGGFSDDGDHNDVWRFDVRERRWHLLSGDLDAGVPAPRYCAAFAYANGRLFMFGGRSRRYPKANYNDLWAFDLASSRWECVHPNRAQQRYDAGAELPGYHAKSSAAVIGDRWFLWGGEGLHGHVSDFWSYSFDSGRWEMLAPARADDPVLW